MHVLTNANGELGGALSVNVDEVSHAGAIDFILLAGKAITQVRVGEIEALTEAKQTIFNGLGIFYSNNNHVVASQKIHCGTTIDGHFSVRESQ